MKCRATTTNFILSLVIASAVAILSTPAAAETNSTRLFSVEVKPLPSLISIVPGGVGVGAEAEAALTENLSMFVDANHMRVRLDDEQMEKLDEDGDDVFKGFSQTAFSLGARYYGSTQEDSWYLGAKAGASSHDAEWVEDSSNIRDKGLSANGSLDAGYRWLWDSGFLLRLGVGASANKLISRNTTTSTDPGASAEKDPEESVDDRLPDELTVTGPTIDFGLGWAF